MKFIPTWFSNTILITANQHVTGSDIIAFISSLVADERYKPSMNQIWDFRSTKKLKLGAADLKNIPAVSANRNTLRKPVFFALVASNTDVRFRLQSTIDYLAHAECSPQNTSYSKLFSTTDDAVNWLKSVVR